MAKAFQKKLKKGWIYLIFLLFSFLLYSYKLDKVPVHLNQDEMEFSLNAHSIATNFSDQDGRFLPFYFWHLGSFWAKPVIVYSTSLFLKFLPLTEGVIRLSSAFAGVLTICLIMLLAHKLFKKRIYTLLAGAISLTTPMLFMHSRVLLDYVFMLPFILMWLIFLKTFLDKGDNLFIFASGLSLGIGFHSYYAAEIFMPLYFLATILFFGKKLKIKSSIIFLLGFSIPLLLMIPWLLKYPDTLLRKISYVGAIDRSVDVARGIWGVLSPSRLGAFLSSYASYFNPKLLFISGDKSLIHSTQRHGAFLFPVVFLFVFGILDIIFRNKDRFSRLLLFGFLTYPVAPAIISEPMRIARGIAVIPFVILISLYGVGYLMRFKERSMKALLYAILLFGFFEFAVFVKGYFTYYPKESYSWFNNDIGGTFESVIKSTRIRDVDSIYIDRNIYFVEQYVKFYSIKFSSDLDKHAKYFDPKTEDFSSFPINSIVAVKAENISGRLDTVKNFEKIETIREPNGYETFYVFYNGI